MQSNFALNREKILLLKSLKKIVTEEIGVSDVNIRSRQDVIELLLEKTEKRRIREIKKIHRKLDEWIRELENENKNKPITIASLV